MELNEEELKNVLGGANPSVISKNQLADDELSEETLQNVGAGIHNKEMMQDLVLENESLYRKKMIDELKAERERIVEENKTRQK